MVMANSSGTTETGSLELQTLYNEACAGIRDTDSISFRLLGLLPLVSGAALLSLMFSKEGTIPGGLIALLGIFGAGISLGLFRWELRNIQTCLWLWRRTEFIQERAFVTGVLAPLSQSRPCSPQRIGKTEAEKLIYSLTIVTWLLLPILQGALDKMAKLLVLLYLGLTVLILALAVASLRADPHVKPISQAPPNPRATADDNRASAVPPLSF